MLSKASERANVMVVLWVITFLRPHIYGQIKIKFPFCICRTLITESTLEPCHLHLVLSTCLIALVVAVNITKRTKLLDMLIKLGEGDKAQCNYGTVVLPEFYEYGTGTLF